MAVDLSKVTSLARYIEEAGPDEREDITAMHEAAMQYLASFKWCGAIVSSAVGMVYPGIIGVFLFNIEPATPGVDNWNWVVVGDLPPAYLSGGVSPTPDAALEGYIDEMMAWVDAVETGASVAGLIPVNAPPTPGTAADLRRRLNLLQERILPDYMQQNR